jgi:hypothetical protein
LLGACHLANLNPASRLHSKLLNAFKPAITSHQNYFCT